MNAYHLIELLIVAAAVVGSLYATLLRLAPQLLGRKLPKSGKACSSCDACGACATPPPQTRNSEQPVRWTQR